VSCGFVIVTACEDGVTDGVVIGDIYTAFVSEDSGFMLPVGEVGAEGEGDRTIHGLEGLEYEGVVGRGRLNAVGESRVNYSDKEQGWEQGDSLVVEV